MRAMAGRNRLYSTNRRKCDQGGQSMSDTKDIHVSNNPPLRLGSRLIAQTLAQSNIEIVQWKR